MERAGALLLEPGELLGRRLVDALLGVGHRAEPNRLTSPDGARRPLDDLAVRRRRASRASSSTRATGIRRAPRPRRGSASSRAARRCSTPPGWRAETAVLLAFARPGTTVALAEGAYFGTSVLLRELRALGDQLRRVRPDRARRPRRTSSGSSRRRTRCSPCPDWEAVRAHGGLVVCDATVSTPVNLRALDEGADVVVHSATKFLTGSHNALLGATVTRDPERTARLREVRSRTGIVASPDAAGAAAARARLARAADAADHGDRDRARLPPRRASGRRARALSRASRA